MRERDLWKQEAVATLIVLVMMLLIGALHAG
jgi:hypothetical protein